MLPSGSTVLWNSCSKSNWVALLSSSRTSCSSASRIICSTLDWNSRDIERARLTQYPATRKARGRSFGPITTSATAPISINSGQPMSNSISWRDHKEGRQIRGLREKRRDDVRKPIGRQILPRLGAVAGATDRAEPPLGIGDVDIDDRDRAAGAPDPCGRG